MKTGKGASVLARSASGTLPPVFERWRVSLQPGEERPTEAAEWSGAIVLVESGTLDVHCTYGGHRTFVAGDMLALGWLPLRSMHNPWPEVVSLLAVRRRGEKPKRRFLHVRRSAGIGCLR